MTVRQLAIFTQREEKTIRRWIQKAGRKSPSLVDKMSSSGHGKAADFTIDEVEEILQASSLSKDAVSILMENARQNAKEKAPAIIDPTTLDILGQLVKATVSSVMESFSNRLSTLERQTIPAALPVQAPKKDSRAHITELVRKYADSERIPYRDVYTMLYTEYGLRTHTNPVKCALNRNLRVIDYIQSAGELETLEAVAVEYLVPEVKFCRGYLAE